MPREAQRTAQRVAKSAIIVDQQYASAAQRWGAVAGAGFNAERLKPGTYILTI